MGSVGRLDCCCDLPDGAKPCELSEYLEDWFDVGDGLLEGRGCLGPRGAGTYSWTSENNRTARQTFWCREPARLSAAVLRMANMVCVVFVCARKYGRGRTGIRQ